MSPASRMPDCCFRLAIAGCAAAIALMLTAWAIYPGGYDWMNRDLSTLGRVFTVNGRGHHVNYPVYNFGLLLWGMSTIVFFSGRAMLLPKAAAARRTLICGFLAGLGLAGIGITPADVPNNLWHGVSSATAILSFAVVICAARKEDEPGKRYWAWGLVIAAIVYIVLRFWKIPHGSVLFQKLFVLYVYTYIIVQSVIALCREKLPLPFPATEPELYRFGRIAVASGTLAMFGLMAAAILAFPGGFDWSSQWTSSLGNVFLDKAARESGTVYRYYMIYDYALAVGGCGLTAFWSLRSLRAKNRWFGAAILVIGWVMGCALAGIGMAATPALGLHRLSINFFILSVTLMLIVQLFPASGCSRRWQERCLWLVLIVVSAVLFHWLGSPWGKFAQKVMILEVGAWLLYQGWAFRAGTESRPPLH